MRKIFIDGGARIAETFDIIKKDFPQYWDYEFILYEPNPKYTETLEILSKEKGFKFVNGAIWDKTIKTNFYVANDVWGDVGSTIHSEKNEKLDRENPYEVQTYDIVEILNEFNNDDYIVLKLDVEGSEYDIVRRLINSNNIDLVDEYLIEWHDQFFQDSKWPLVEEISKHKPCKDWNY